MREAAPRSPSLRYERPNQPWVCGLACEGRACPAGPSERGVCPALAECVPARDGDRWKCNRSALRGGPCDEGPSPEGECGCVNRCQPMRSLRAMRGRFVFACTLLVFGGLFILLSADWRDAVISPGPLAQQHAQLMSGRASVAFSSNSTESCARCHAAAERGSIGWVASLIAGHGDRMDQPDRCMKCHDTSISEEFALLAHNLPPDVLQQVSAFAGGSWGTDAGGRAINELACAVCHREHQGKAFDLTAMNDSACQSCHHRRYESFAADHPDFGSWPYERRTRIAFDHASHRAKHFAEKQQAFDCRSCHLDDTTGQFQLTARYETACAACHDEKIATSVADGVPMLMLPTLDTDALKSAGHAIAGWPDDATGDFDGRLPPMMKLLLAADPTAAHAIATLGEDFEFLDVDPDDSDQLAACAALANAIEELLVDLARRGPLAIQQRLSSALERPVSEAEARAVVAGMSTEAIRGAVQAWFSGRHELGELSSKPTGVGLDPPYPTTNAPPGIWTRDDATFSIRYQPAVHTDPVLTGWLELLASANRPLTIAILKELTKPTAPGLCASCHSVEQADGGALVINWRAYDRRQTPRGFTKFSHEPHLLLPQLADCTQCHAIDDTVDTSGSYATRNPHEFHTEFAPLRKQACSECHVARAAGDRCQQCHNYHLGEVETWRSISNPRVTRSAVTNAEAAGASAR